MADNSRATTLKGGKKGKVNSNSEEVNRTIDGVTASLSEIAAKLSTVVEMASAESGSIKNKASTSASRSKVSSAFSNVFFSPITGSNNLDQKITLDVTVRDILVGTIWCFVIILAFILVSVLVNKASDSIN